MKNRKKTTSRIINALTKTVFLFFLNFAICSYLVNVHFWAIPVQWTCELNFFLREREREREKERDREREWERERERDKKREWERERDRQRKKEKETNKESEREKDIDYPSSRPRLFTVAPSQNIVIYIYIIYLQLQHPRTL